MFMNSIALANQLDVREIPGFRGFSKLKRDGVLRTGLETNVADTAAVQAEIGKVADLQFPTQFHCSGNRWTHPAGRVIVEKHRGDYHIRYYDTASGFEADSRVNP